MTEAAVVEAEPGLSDSPLVLVSFQKNAQRKLKFLEGEPKALGITQICLSVFQSSCMFSFITRDDVERTWIAGFFIISSILIFIAGSVAIASKNLHLPTLKACVGMEIVATVASFFCLILLMAMDGGYCYHAEYENSTFYEAAGYCRQVEISRYHLLTELVVIQVTLLSISVTLAIYACKVVNCCSSAPKVPVITIQAPPPAPQ